MDVLSPSRPPTLRHGCSEAFAASTVRLRDGHFVQSGRAISSCVYIPGGSLAYGRINADSLQGMCETEEGGK